MAISLGLHAPEKAKAGFVSVMAKEQRRTGAGKIDDCEFKFMPREREKLRMQKVFCAKGAG